VTLPIPWRRVGHPAGVHGCFRAAQARSLGSGVPQAGLYSLRNQAALKLGHSTQYCEDHFPGRRAGVHLLRQRDEFDAERPKRLQRPEQVRNGARKTVELPNGDTIEAPAVRVREHAV
jgi:hypothetical protein